MEEQQTLRGNASGAIPPCANGEGQKSMAARPSAGVPHRVVDLRNQITAGPSRPATGDGANSHPPAAESKRAAGSKRWERT